MLSSSIACYLENRPLPGRWTVEGCDRHDFTSAVVIPALAEGSSLFATLKTLAQNPPELLKCFLVLVVVNHRVDAAVADQADNLALSAALTSYSRPSGTGCAVSTDRERLASAPSTAGSMPCEPCGSSTIFAVASTRRLNRSSPCRPCCSAPGWSQPASRRDNCCSCADCRDKNLVLSPAVDRSDFFLHLP